MSTSNFPPPSGVADEIMVKAIECLDRDVWDSIGNYGVTIRTVLFSKKEATIFISENGPDVLKYGTPSTPYRDAFREALGRATERERIKRMEPLLAIISDESKEARSKHMEQRKNALAIGALAVGVLALIGFVYWGITSAAQSSAAEEARANEVNKYGFRRGAIYSRKVWPDDCASSGYTYPSVENPRTYSFDSIYDCRSRWERWERDGDIWVDWKDEP